MKKIIYMMMSFIMATLMARMDGNTDIQKMASNFAGLTQARLSSGGDIKIPLAQELEQLMELRRSYRYQDGDLPVRPTDASDRYRVGAASPIVTEGDLMGCVLLLSEDGAPALGEAEQRLVQTVAGFLGRQMES